MMASSKKKRKLPGDLFQATEMARASIASSGNISEAYKALNEATLSNYMDSCSLRHGMSSQSLQSHVWSARVSHKLTAVPLLEDTNRE